MIDGMRKTKAKAIEVTIPLVKENLPEAPDGYSYFIERITPQVIKVWLNHHQEYDYACGKPVRTIYCFIKRDVVHAAKNQDKMRVSSSCNLSELSQQSPYTVIKPDPKALAEFMAEFNCSRLPL